MPKAFEYVQQLEHLKVKLEDIPDILNSHTCLKKWIVGIHDKDENTKPHIHIMGYTGSGSDGSNLNFNDVAKWFKDSPQYVEKIKSKWNRAALYLIHGGNSDKEAGKHQYSPDDLISNYDFRDDLKSAMASEETKKKRLSIDEILEKIGTGEIKEYNRFQYIDDITLARNNSLFNAAFKNRSEKVMTDFNRNIQVFFITGDTGSYKTTYAKEIAKSIGDGSYYISSSKNDSLQDYKGQDTLILDDLRDDAFDFADLLKVLDNHTASSIKSRFFNKMFLGKCIIITSTKQIMEWYSHINEDRDQFYRRISAYIIMDKKEISTYEMQYDKVQDKYKIVWQYTLPNYLKNLYPPEDKKDTLKNLLSLAESMSGAISNIKYSEDFENKFNDAIDKLREIKNSSDNT